MCLVAQKAEAESRGFAFAARLARLSAMQSLAATGFARRTRRLWPALAAIATCLCLAVSARAGDVPLIGTIEWRASDNLVDAQIEGWPLQKVLEQIAARTSWHVYA